MGGLGNQLFQYAYARALKELGKEVVLDTTTFFNIEAFSPGTTFRNYFLDKFTISLKPASKNICTLFSNTGQKNIALRLINRLKKQFLFRIKHINFDTYFLFSPDALIVSGNTYISGYFQTEKYFFNIRDILLNELSLKDGKNTKIENFPYTNNRGGDNYIAVHIRRGDYVSGGCALDVEYYLKAFKYIEEKIQTPVYCIFSDDLNFCMENLKLENRQYQFINNNREYTDYEELIIMSKCNHHIIANSSFSWWGAWLCKNPNQIVIAPSRWTETETENVRDIVPERWIRL